MVFMQIKLYPLMSKHEFQVAISTEKRHNSAIIFCLYGVLYERSFAI